MTQTDSWAGIADRCRFDQVLSVEWQRAKRSGRPLSLLLVAIEDVKSRNGDSGAGNECLHVVAHRLYAEGKRAGDLVARIEDTEFALILPEVNQIGAMSLAESIRAAIASLDLPHAPASAAPHVSLGVATRVPEMEASPDELLKLAKHALAEARRGGAGRVVQADHLGLAAA